MVTAVDQQIAWVSNCFAEHIGLSVDDVIGRSIFDLLDSSTNESWSGVFTSSMSGDETFDRFGVHLVGDPESVDRFELYGIRYVDGGRSVMVSLRLETAEPEWESHEVFVAAVRAAMDSGDIYVAYQPIVDLSSGLPTKLEALARWHDPDRGVIGPEKFIPWAETTGVIVELGEWILARACQDVAKMATHGIDVDLSVNVSVVQLRHADVACRFGDVVARSELAPGRVCIEVTESVLLDADAIASLEEIHALGVRLAIDDFGTGYASFEYLTRLVVDSLKVDTAFVAGLGTDSRATAIVRSVLSLGRELGLEVVAEGVETESQRAQLLEMNCRLGQGWLFSRALPYEDLVALYALSGTKSISTAIERSAGVAESVRLSALRACRILDTDPEPGFDAIVRLTSQLLDAPIALISLTDARRQWFKARVGTARTEISRSAPFASVARVDPNQPFIGGGASPDGHTAPSPGESGALHTASFAEMPIRSREGLVLGALVVVDATQRDFTSPDLGQLALLADQVSAILDLRRRTVELGDLYVGARPRDRSASAVDANFRAGVAAVPCNEALGQLTRVAGRSAAPASDGANILRFGRLSLDLDDRTASINGVALVAPAKEFDLLAFLAARPGHVFSRTELLHHVWNSKPEWQAPSTVTEHIHRLRGKLDPDSNRPSVLRTVRGKGYAFQPASEPTAMPDVVEARWGSWVQVNGRVVDVDQGMLALLAADTPAELIGREVTDFVASASQPAVRAGREMRAGGLVPGPQVITLRAVDGTELMALITTDGTEFEGAPAVVGIAHEIVNSQRLIRQMVSGVIEEVSDAVIITDSDLRVLSWNPAAERLYGWSEQEALGHTVDAVVGADSALYGGTVRDELQVNGRWTGALRQRARDGSRLTVVSAVNLVRDHGDGGIAVVNRLVQSEVVSAQSRGASELPSAPRVRPLEPGMDQQADVMPAHVHRSAGTGEPSLHSSVATLTRVRRRSLAATTDLTAIDPEASVLRLAAARSLLRAEAVEEAVGVVIELVRDLGGATVPARLDDGEALPIDCSFGHGEPLLPRADSVLARLRIERLLPEVLDDARVAIGRLRQRDDFAELSNTDPLTGLLNRRAVDKLLTRLRPDDALVVIDIDHFKDINDLWGHAVGDDVLITFARAMRSQSRQGDQFGRLGGDELLAVLSGAGHAGVTSFLHRLNETWATARQHEVTYSAGAALVAHRSGPETLAAADKALYSAKASGRNRHNVDATRDRPAAASTQGEPQ